MFFHGGDAGAACGDAFPVAPSHSQAALVQAVARHFSIGPGHELIFDTTWGVEGTYTRKQILDAGVPFKVAQLDYLPEHHDDSFGHAMVTLRPVTRGPLDLRFTMGVRDFSTWRITPERKLEIRREMSAGNVAILGDDPHLDVMFSIRCEGAQEARDWRDAVPGRNLRMARSSEVVLLEDMGVFEATARMRRSYQSEVLVRPVMMLVTTYDDYTSLSGMLRVVGSVERHPLVESLGLYAKMYETLSEGRPGLLGLSPSGSLREIPPGVAEIRQAYEKSAAAEARTPAVRTFRLNCPAGELNIEGYENEWLKLVPSFRAVIAAKALAQSTSEAPPAQAVATEAPSTAEAKAVPPVPPIPVASEEALATPPSTEEPEAVAPAAPVAARAKRARTGVTKSKPKRPSRKGTARNRRAPATQPTVDAKPPQE